MFGTILNVAGIFLGGGAGLALRKPFSLATESFFKIALAVFTVFYGLRLTWLSLEGSFLHLLKQLATAVIALMLGAVAGRLLHFQAFSNELGRSARQTIASTRPGDPQALSAGFKTCSALFCAAPLGILGAVQDGFSGYFYPLAVKAAMDGLAAMGFVTVFGWGTLLAALPVLALQGTITLACSQYLRPFLETHGGDALVQSINCAGGLLVFSVALVILGVKKIRLADYSPSLVVAPLLTLWWGR